MIEGNYVFATFCCWFLWYSTKQEIKLQKTLGGKLIHIERDGWKIKFVRK